MSEYMHRATGLRAVVEIDEDGAFCASVPELPGCVAGGDTLEEALSDLDWALETVLELIRKDDRTRYAELVGRSTGSKISIVESTSTAPGTFGQLAAAL